MNALIKKELFEGKFEIQGEIAKGQTGTILYGYDLGLRQEVAIKIYHSHINGRLIRGKAFIEKSKPLLLIDHPNLIKIFKVEEESDTPVVFMEFFDAPSLQQRIHDKGPMPVQDMLRLAREIAEVLVHTHFQGIIHGTLHPGHVLVGPQGQVKVLDLGLSWILMDILSNCDVELLRPLPYLLPEMAKEELLTVSSDIYCLGFMMYEMLTGTVPYAGLPKTSIMGKLSFDQSDPVLDFPDSVPEVICDLIRDMTRNKAQERLQDSTHVLTIINQQLTKLPLSDKSTLLPSRTPQPQAPAPKEPTNPERIPAPSTPPDPAPSTTPAFKRPQASVNYGQAQQATGLRKISITLGILVLIGLAGTLGYWYRDMLEPHFSILQEESSDSSPGRNLPQADPLESAPSIVPVQNSVKTQEPFSGTDELHQKWIQQLAPQKETEGGALPNPTSLSPQPEGQPNQTQLPRSRESKQAQSIIPTSKRTIPKQPTTQTKQETTVAPIQKQVTPKQLTPPSKQPPSKLTPGGKTGDLPPTTKVIKDTRIQKLISQQPAANTATPIPSPALQQKQQASTQAIAPIEKPSSKVIPTIPQLTPLTTPKKSQQGNLTSPASLEPQKEPATTVTNQIKEHPSPAPSSKDSTHELADEEIEELLQSFDAPTADSSLISAP